MVFCSVWGRRVGGSGAGLLPNVKICGELQQSVALTLSLWTPECFLALNSAVTHQGNLSKHYRVETQHILHLFPPDRIYGTPLFMQQRGGRE